MVYKDSLTVCTVHEFLTIVRLNIKHFPKQK